jgi:hypothetical protein
MLHPGSGRLVTATWKAPRSGMVSLAAQFQDAAQGAATTDTGVAWFIQLGTRTPLAQGLLPAGGTSALIEQQSLLVAEGDLLHFGLDPRGACLTDATSVIARVSYGAAAAPAPGRRLDDAPPEAPATAQRLLPGGDQTLRYGGGSSDFVVLKGGTDVVDWPVGSGSSAANYVASGILACDQALRYDLSGATVLLKGGTAVTFRYFSPLTTVPGYVASGTLSSTAPAQPLPYGYEAGYTLNFQPGSLIAFFQYKTSGITANGYVSSGTAGQAQSVYFGYQSGASLTVQPGSLCTFKHSPTNGSAQSGYLQSGKMNTDSYLPYGFAGGTVKIRKSHQLYFLHFKYPGSACNGYLTAGPLAENASLPYGLGTSLLCLADTTAAFRYIQTGSTSPTSTGYLESGTPAANATVKFGSQAGATVTILAGKIARFSLLGTLSPTNPAITTGPGQAGFLVSATTASIVPLSLPYSVSVPVRYATVQANQPFSFARISTSNSNGYLNSGVLALNQTIYKPNSTTVIGPDGATLVANIPSSGAATVDLITSDLILLDSDGDGMGDAFEYLYNFNPLSAADATGDPDADGLSNLWEYRLATHPRQADSNGNGIQDGAEDPDKDGLTCAFEITTSNTNPAFYDTDGDLLPDGWEVAHGLNPKSAIDHNGLLGDPDGDGVTNYLEFIHGTHPNRANSDFDAQDDGVEIAQASNPLDASDNGVGPPPDRIVEVPFEVGDDSNSHSEQWKMIITSMDKAKDSRKPFDFFNPVHGTVGTPPTIFKLIKGTPYEIRLEWQSSKLDAAVKDFDWLARADLKPMTNTDAPESEFFVVKDHWIMDNRQHLMGRLPDEQGDDRVNKAANRTAFLVPIDIEEVISDQIAGNECNKLPTPYYRNAGGTGGPNNPMLMATRTGRVAHLAIKMNVTAAIASKFFVGVREVGSTTVLGSTVSIAAPGKTLLQFTANTGHKIYEVVAGYDASGNTALENEEVAVIFEKTPKRDSTGAAVTANLGNLDKIVIVEQGQFVDSKNFLTGGGDLPFSDYAGDLIEAFGEGANTVPDATTTAGIVVRSTHPSLTHQVGAKWNAACEDTTHRLDFTDGTKPSNDFEASNALKTIIDTVIQEHITALITYGTGKPGWPVLALPSFSKLNSFRASEGPGVGFGGINELHLAFGSVTITGALQVSFRVLNPTTIEVGSISVSGSFDDLYDFDYWSGSIPQSAAIVQAGYASLSTAANPSGRLFYTRLNCATGIALNKNFIK